MRLGEEATDALLLGMAASGQGGAASGNVGGVGAGGAYVSARASADEMRDEATSPSSALFDAIVDVDAIRRR